MSSSPAQARGTAPKDRFAWERLFRAVELPGTPAEVQRLRLLGLLLATYADRDGTVPRRYAPSTQTIAVEMGFTGTNRTRTTQLVKKLVDLGWLEVRSGRRERTRNEYVLRVPSDVVQGLEPAGDCALSEPDCAVPVTSAASDVHTSTHPHMFNHPPNPPTPTRTQRALRADQREAVQAFMSRLEQHATADGWLDDYGRLEDGLERSGQTRHRFEALLASLIADGHGRQAGEALLERRREAFASPFAGAADVAGTAIARLQDVRGRLSYSCVATPRGQAYLDTALSGFFQEQARRRAEGMPRGMCADLEG